MSSGYYNPDEYYSSLRKGICPECKSIGKITVEETTEYENDQPKKFTVIRCGVCGKSWLPNVLIEVKDK